MTKEQIIKHIIGEHSRCLHLSSELSENDEDYDYVDGVLDGRMRSLRNILDLIRRMDVEPTPAKRATLAELYVINNSWKYFTMFTIYDEDKEVTRMEASTALKVYGNRVVKAFDENIIFV